MPNRAAHRAGAHFANSLESRLDTGKLIERTLKLTFIFSNHILCLDPQVFRQYVMWCFPGTLMILAGLIPDLSIPYSYKFGLALMAMGLVYVLLR